MTFKQYCRIERSLGGVGCTDHLFIRDGLAYLNKARRLAFSELINRENNIKPWEGELNQAWHLNEISKYGYGE